MRARVAPAHGEANAAYRQRRDARRLALGTAGSLKKFVHLGDGSPVPMVLPTVYQAAKELGVRPGFSPSL